MLAYKLGYNLLKTFVDNKFYKLLTSTVIFCLKTIKSRSFQLHSIKAENKNE